MAGDVHTQARGYGSLRNPAGSRGQTGTASTARDKEKIPRILIKAVLGLLATVIVLVGAHQLLGVRPASHVASFPIVTEREITITGTIGGAARVVDADGQVIVDLATGEGVFISTIDRALRRERLKHAVDPNGPYILRMREGDRVTLYDPSTGRETYLRSFGRDNAADFAALLNK